jgi:hypothetical protein
MFKAISQEESDEQMKALPGILGTVFVIWLIWMAWPASEPTPEEIAQEEARTERMESERRADELMKESRARAYLQQAEADNAIRERSTARRLELIAESINYSTLDSFGDTIDSFELPGNRFITCTMSYPGPIYTCDGE